MRKVFDYASLVLSIFCLNCSNNADQKIDKYNPKHEVITSIVVDNKIKTQKDLVTETKYGLITYQFYGNPENLEWLYNLGKGDIIETIVYMPSLENFKQKNYHEIVLSSDNVMIIDLKNETYFDDAF